MNIKDFPEKNKIFIAEGCNDLPAFDNGEVIISCWSLDELDKMCAVFFGEIWLTIWGGGQPPVRLDAQTPFLGEDGKRLNAQKMVDAFIERKVKQFLILNLRRTDDLAEIDFWQSDDTKRVFINFVHFIFERQS